MVDTCEHGVAAHLLCTACAFLAEESEKVCAHVECERAATDEAYGFEWCRGHLFTAHQWRMTA